MHTALMLTARSVFFSNYFDPKTTTKSSDAIEKGKTYIEVDFTAVAQEYSKSMGVVHLADVMISLYRTIIKMKR